MIALIMGLVSFVVGLYCASSVWFTESISGGIAAYSAGRYGVPPTVLVFVALVVGLLLSSRRTFRPVQWLDRKRNAVVIFKNNKIFYGALLMLVVLLHVVFLYWNLTAFFLLKQYMEFNAITLEKTSFYGFKLSYSVLISCLIVFFTLCLLVTKREDEGGKLELNQTFGWAVLSALVLDVYCLFNVKLGVLLENIQRDAVFDFLWYALLSSLAALFFAVALLKKSASKGRRFSEFVVGVSSYAIAMSLTVGLLAYKPLDLLENNPTHVKLDVKGSDLKISLGILSEMDNREVEDLVEYYIGVRSSGNVMGLLNYVLSDSYEGDKTEAIHFVSELTLNNMRIRAERNDRLEEIFETEDLGLSDVVSLFGPYANYNASPLHHQERMLVSILEGRYQEAVDFYVEDALNQDKPYLTGLDGHEIKTVGSFGIWATQSLLASILNNDLASLDLSLIRDPKRRSKIPDVLSFALYPTREVHDWEGVFGYNQKEAL